MWLNIEVMCFAASYGVALVLEITRILFRSGTRRVVLVGFALAGLFAHTIFLTQLAFKEGPAPLSSSFAWYMVAAYALAIIYLYISYYHPRQAIGVFVLPLVLALIGLGQSASTTPFPKEDAQRAWGMIHGGFLLGGTVAILVGFVAGIMYLVQAYRLKHKLPPKKNFQLPSLEWLQRANERAIVVSVALFILGFLTGMLLNVYSHRRDLVARVPWTDPVVWTTGVLLAWLIAATAFNAFYKPARLGKKVAYLTVATFLVLVFVVSARLLLDSEHTGEQASAVRPLPVWLEAAR